jgi:predicted dehydrogenase
MSKEKSGIALVGLGKYSEGQLAPALKETKHCELRGIVTGSDEKARQWKEKHNLADKNIYNYQNFDSIKDNADIDIVYVVLPNSMHAEYTIRAAKAGKHVICEKPMAISLQECADMILVCEQANRLLSIGYRLHFEPYNLAMMEVHKKCGRVKTVTAENGMEVEAGVWRIDKKLSGGGPLMDLGIYCVQGAIYTIGENPVAMTAKEGKKNDPEKFKNGEESLSWTMEFPGGTMAHCKTSYSEEHNLLRAEAENGWMQLAPAYEYSGLKGTTSEGKMDLPDVNEQAFQMDDFALCVRNNKKSKVAGEMGLRDVKILMPIYEAMETGQRIEIV